MNRLTKVAVFWSMKSFRVKRVWANKMIWCQGRYRRKNRVRAIQTTNILKQHDLVLMTTSTNECTQCPQIHDHTLEHTVSTDT